MEDETIKKLYREYLEEALNLKYKKMIIERSYLTYKPTYFLKSVDGDNNPDCEKFEDLIELDNGNFLGENDNVFVFFNSDGEELVRLNDVHVNKFHNGYARVHSIRAPHLCQYIDMNGKYISDKKWGRGSRDFECGRAMVDGVEGGINAKYGYIDESGEVVVPFMSTRSYSFSDDVCCVEKQGKNYYYDRDGNELFSDAFTSPYFHNGLAAFGDGKDFGFKNKKGEIVFKVRDGSASSFSNGLAKCKNGHINLNGNSVKVSCLDDGVPYIKGILRPTYYNCLKEAYVRLECTPYKDLDDYLLCVNRTSELIIYSKESGVYTHTGLQYMSGEISTFRKGNLLEINGNTFFLKPSGCVSLSATLDLANVLSFEDGNVVSYDEFSTNVKRDKTYFDRIISENRRLNAKKIQDEVNKSKLEEDRKRQEIIEQLTSLKEALTKLDSGAGNLSRIDADILLRKVDDHFEINPEFVSQLKFLDLSCISFDNVKVSGLDFSGSNASINPQLVYNKDMSYGKYDGLTFISSNFNDVNITGASFEGCVMDFAMMDGAINNEDNKSGSMK